MSRNLQKRTISDMCVKRRLKSVYAVWSVFVVQFASLAIQNAPNKDSDKTARIAGFTYPKVHVRFLTLRLK